MMISDIYSLAECVVGGWFILWGIVACSNVCSVRNLIKFFSNKENTPILQSVYLGLMPIGLFIVFSHNEWLFSPAVFVTLVGWSVIIQSVLWLVIPKYTRKIVEIPVWSHHLFIRGTGALSLALGVAILFPYFVI